MSPSCNRTSRLVSKSSRGEYDAVRTYGGTLAEQAEVDGEDGRRREMDGRRGGRLIMINSVYFCLDGAINIIADCTLGKPARHALEISDLNHLISYRTIIYR